MEVYLIDLQVRANRNLAKEVKEFLESKGIEVLGCNGYVDPDFEEGE
tara:strand:- start:15 stop:155 length:141 start_codon:yes stop_codon:yes gene_type:complete